MWYAYIYISNIYIHRLQCAQIRIRIGSARINNKVQVEVLYDRPLMKHTA